VGGKLDAVVMTAGTGGTITGVAKVVKRELPNCRSSASIRRARSSPARGEIKTYKVEGIGYDFIPDVLDRRLVTQWNQITIAIRSSPRAS